MEINNKYMVDEYAQEQGGDMRKYVNAKYDIHDYFRHLSDCEKIIIHCTATDSEAWEDPIACINYDITPNPKHHISRSGTPMATYHFYINKKGECYQLVSMNLQTWNCAGHNKDSVAICINRGAVKENITQKQYENLVECICHVFDLLDWGYDEWGVKERLFFHRDFNSNKTCPGYLDKDILIRAVIYKLKIRGDLL